MKLRRKGRLFQGAFDYIFPTAMALIDVFKIGLLLSGKVINNESRITRNHRRRGCSGLYG